MRSAHFNQSLREWSHNFQKINEGQDGSEIAMQDGDVVYHKDMPEAAATGDNFKKIKVNRLPIIKGTSALVPLPVVSREMKIIKKQNQKFFVNRNLVTSIKSPMEGSQIQGRQQLLTSKADYVNMVSPVSYAQSGLNEINNLIEQGARQSLRRIQLENSAKVSRLNRKVIVME